jgi:hypothetical protein
MNRLLFTANPPEKLELSNSGRAGKHMPGVVLCQLHSLNQSLNSVVRAGRNCGRVNLDADLVQCALMLTGECEDETCFARGSTS